MRHHNKQYYRTKSGSFLSKLTNTFMTICMTVALMWGLQACSNVSALRFVQLSDVHFLENGSNTTFKMIGESPRLLDDAIAQINEQKDLDFVMITGDLIDKPLEKELKAVLPHMQKLEYPWYFAFGNHDRCVGGYLQTDLYMKMLREANPDFDFEKSYYSFVPKKGYRVIVLDDIITDEVTSQGYVDEKQLKWLKKELDKAKGDTALIFMHVPLIEPFSSPNHRLRNASRVMGLIESYKNPIGVFQGHYHATRVVQHDNVLYVNTPALVSYPDAFRLITVQNYKDKTVFELKWFETREKTIQKMAKLLVIASSIYTGEEKERNGVYEIQK